MIEYVELFDYYGCLFTERQQQYFMDYYFNNLTLQEIAYNNKVSRNAVHKNLKEIIKKLEYYEEKLKLNQNRKKILKILDDVDINIKKEIEELV